MCNGCVMRKKSVFSYDGLLLTAFLLRNVNFANFDWVSVLFAIILFELTFSSSVGDKLQHSSATYYQQTFLENLYSQNCPYMNELGIGSMVDFCFMISGFHKYQITFMPGKRGIPSPFVHEPMRTATAHVVWLEWEVVPANCNWSDSRGRYLTANMPTCA